MNLDRFDGFNAKDIVKQLKKEQETPFNPELLGFKEIDLEDFRYKFFLKGGCFWIRQSKNPELQHIFSLKTSDKDSFSALCFKIPNHQFGVDLLKSLWIIE